MPNTAGMWSRQGNQIAYIHYGAANCDGSVDAEIWVMAANGSSKKRLTPCGVDAKWLSWGP